MPTKFGRHPFTRSEVILRTDGYKQTDRHTDVRGDHSSYPTPYTGAQVILILIVVRARVTRARVRVSRLAAAASSDAATCRTGVRLYCRRGCQQQQQARSSHARLMLKGQNSSSTYCSLSSVIKLVFSDCK